MTTRSKWSGRLVLAPGLLLYIGPGAPAEEHAHASVQLVYAFEGEVRLRVPGRPPWTGRSAIVPANVRHAFDGSGAVLALLLVERHGSRGVWIEGRARELANHDLVSSIGPLAPPTPERGTAGAVAWCDQLFERLGYREDAPHGGALSDPVRQALAFLERPLTSPARLSDAAASAHVSPTRLTHLFTAEVGIPFRRFALWRRIQRAAEEVRDGRDLTGAATAAGFADAAHFSRTFRAMFGLSPSSVLPSLDIAGTPREAAPRAR